MQLSAVLLLAFGLTLSAKTVSQTVSLSGKDLPIQQVITVIYQQTGYSVLARTETLKSIGKVSVDVKDMMLDEFVELILKGKPYAFEVDAKTIYIKRKQPAMPGKPQLISPFPNSPPITVRGRIINEKGEPVVGASVRVKGTNKGTNTDENGEFTINGVDVNSILQISSVNIETFEWKVDNKSDLTLTAKTVSKAMGEVTVQGNTGYQVINKDHPGSFDVVSNELLNRNLSTNIINRIENLTTGVSFRNGNDGLLIRGRNSIFSTVNPLIVLDNFPYDGDINNINPNDIATITILKDAASASQWGARAGNGVIVITTKKGKSARPAVQLNSFVVFQDKPDLYSLPIISSSDYIEVEKWLFEKGYYNNDINNNTTHPPLTPVVEMLAKNSLGEIPDDEAHTLIEAMKNTDVRQDLQEYFYRRAISQQNHISVSGNNARANYYLSAGWDRNLQNLVGQQVNRVTLRSLNSFKLTNKLRFDAGLNYTLSDNESQNNLGIMTSSGSGKGLYPYADLVNENSGALALVRDFRSGYTDTAGGGKLLNWKYFPYDNIKTQENLSRTRDVLLTIGLQYQLLDGLHVQASYQFENSLLTNRTLNDADSYFARDLINRFYQPNALNKYPVPLGGILNLGESEIISHQGRIQGNYNRSWGKHRLSAIAGWEIKNMTSKSVNSIIYGYNRDGSTVNPNMDFVTSFPLFSNPGNFSRVPNSQSVGESLDRFISSYGNVLYSFKERYTASISARTDAANLFGVNTNQRGVPLWSAGINWQLSEERFYSLKWMPLLRLRASYGYNGNFSRLTSAYTTATYGINSLGSRSALVVNPPNDKLRWEQVRVLNAGADFSLFNNRIYGSIEYYKKNNVDLMGAGPIDPTYGLSDGSGIPTIYANLASMKGRGVEVEINTVNINRKFKWQTSFLFSYANSTVSEYLLPPSDQAVTYIGNTSGVTPIIGKPIFTVFSYRWGGLDPATGDPRGYSGKDLSTDYNAIINTTSVDSLVYNGAVQPPYFGALRNSFEWKGISLSFNLSYKFAYYFRRNSINYGDLFRTWAGHSDYSLRWQEPGDESKTNIPSLVYTDYPQFSGRDMFYGISQVLVEKGDHIRLDDISLGYDMDNSKIKNLPFSKIRIYTYLSELNILLWKANNAGLDPYFISNPISGKKVTVGLNITF